MPLRSYSLCFRTPTFISTPAMIRSDQLPFLLLGLLLGCQLASSQVVLLEIQLDRLEQIGGEHLMNISRLRYMKYNRTMYVANGTFTLQKDLDQSYEGTVTFARSALGNQQFNEYPMKLSRNSLCKGYSEHGPEYQYLWANNTNFPQVVKGVELCPLPKGEYWIRNLAPESSWVPPVVPEGYWRLTLEIFGPTGDSELVLRSFFYLKKLLTRQT